MENIHRIIGITGAFGSGKTTTANFFATRGFTKIILSSFLEEEAKKRTPEKITRKMLQDIGNEWREKYGKGVLASKTLGYIEKNNLTRVVIDGIRNIGEIEILRSSKNFILIGVIANRKTRFKRLQSFERREKLNWDLFQKLDYRDLGIGEKDTGLQVAYCLALADMFVENNERIQNLETKLDQIVKTQRTYDKNI